MSIEDVRTYWNNRPCNIMHSLVDIDEDPLLYSQQVTARKFFVEPHIPGFAEFERWKGKHVLELGCGIGTDTIEFARAGAQVDAVDISGRSLAIARQRAVAEGLVPSIGRLHLYFELPQSVILRNEVTKNLPFSQRSRDSSLPTVAQNDIRAEEQDKCDCPTLCGCWRRCVRSSGREW